MDAGGCTFFGAPGGSEVENGARQILWLAAEGYELPSLVFQSLYLCCTCTVNLRLAILPTCRVFQGGTPGLWIETGGDRVSDTMHTCNIELL
jgi:hypothetical protein